MVRTAKLTDTDDSSCCSHTFSHKLEPNKTKFVQSLSTNRKRDIDGRLSLVRYSRDVDTVRVPTYMLPRDKKAVRSPYISHLNPRNRQRALLDVRPNESSNVLTDLEVQAEMKIRNVLSSIKTDLFDKGPEILSLREEQPHNSESNSLSSKYIASKAGSQLTRSTYSQRIFPAFEPDTQNPLSGGKVWLPNRFHSRDPKVASNQTTAHRRGK